MPTPNKDDLLKRRERDLDKSYIEMLEEPNRHLREIRRQLYLFKQQKLVDDVVEAVIRIAQVRNGK